MSVTSSKGWSVEWPYLNPYCLKYSMSSLFKWANAAIYLLYIRFSVILDKTFSTDTSWQLLSWALGPFLRIWVTTATLSFCRNTPFLEEKLKYQFIFDMLCYGDLYFIESSSVLRMQITVESSSSLTRLINTGHVKLLPKYDKMLAEQCLKSFATLGPTCVKHLLNWDAGTLGFFQYSAIEINHLARLSIIRFTIGHQIFRK